MEPTDQANLERLVQALIDGVPAAAVKAKMETLEARKIEIAAKLQDAPEQKPALHPAMAGMELSKETGLRRARALASVCP